MKIFLISNMYPSKEDPDYGIFVYNIEKALEKNGAWITEKAVISGRPKSTTDKLNKYRKFYADIFSAYRKGNFDMVYLHFISHSSPGLLLAKFLIGKKKKIVINVHGSDILVHNKGILKACNEILLKHTDLLVVPSDFFKKIIEKVFPNFPKNKLYISPSGGIDSDIFYLQKNKTNQNNFHLGYVSRIEEEKGWRIFLQALKILKTNNFRFQASIVGTGSEVKDLMEKISDYDLQEQVAYCGVLSQGELNNFYNELDLFIFPTKAEESLGLVGLEAMACGTPIIGSKIAGLKTFIKDKENGLFFTSGKDKELVEKINYYFHLPENEKLKMQKEAVKTSEQYQEDRVAKALFEKFKQLLIKA